MLTSGDLISPAMSRDNAIITLNVPHTVCSFYSVLLILLFCISLISTHM